MAKPERSAIDSIKDYRVIGDLLHGAHSFKGKIFPKIPKFSLQKGSFGVSRRGQCAVLVPSVNNASRLPPPLLAL